MTFKEFYKSTGKEIKCVKNYKHWKEGEKYWIFIKLDSIFRLPFIFNEKKNFIQVTTEELKFFFDVQEEKSTTFKPRGETIRCNINEYLSTWTKSVQELLNSDKNEKKIKSTDEEILSRAFDLIKNSKKGAKRFYIGIEDKNNNLLKGYICATKNYFISQFLPKKERPQPTTQEFINLVESGEVEEIKPDNTRKVKIKELVFTPENKYIVCEMGFTWFWNEGNFKVIYKG